MNEKDQTMKDRQIEEITRVICQSNRGGICGYDRKPCHFDCGNYQLATNFYNAGYRKSTDLAEEIFAEIDKVAYKLMNSPYYSIGDTVYDLAELKKKYTEEGK